VSALQLSAAQADEDHLHKHLLKQHKVELDKFKKDQAKEKKQKNESMKRVGSSACTGDFTVTLGLYWCISYHHVL